MRYLLLAFFCLSAPLLYAQTFDEWIGTATALYEQEDYPGSARAYEQAFALVAGSALQYYNAACSSSLAGDTSQAIRYLNLSADNGWRALAHLKRDPDLRALHELPGWEKVVARVKANLDEFEKDFDQPLKQQLDQIYLRDQTLRQLYQEAEEKFGKESEQMTYFWDLISAEDRKNEVELVEILEQRGWPGRSLVGGRANMTVWLVLQHAPLELQEKYLPLLRASVEEGESSGRHLATLEDRILVRNGQPQLYGTQFFFDEEKGQNVLYDIKEPESVDQRRQEVGLGPIGEYARRFGISWEENQR